MEHVYVGYLDTKIVKALDEYVMEEKNKSYREGHQDGSDEGYTTGYEDAEESIRAQEAEEEE